MGLHEEAEGCETTQIHNRTAEKQSLCGKVYIFVNDSPAKQSYDFVLSLQKKLKLAVEKTFNLEKRN